MQCCAAMNTLLTNAPCISQLNHACTSHGTLLPSCVRDSNISHRVNRSKLKRLICSPLDKKCSTLRPCLQAIHWSLWIYWSSLKRAQCSLVSSWSSWRNTGKSRTNRARDSCSWCVMDCIRYSWRCVVWDPMRTDARCQHGDSFTYRWLFEVDTLWSESTGGSTVIPRDD